jgi:hypothetical protein|nr:MAG TPA: hypothetical protein [Caudoviricetes sp.]
MSNVNETLKQRGAVYGDYKGGSEFRANVMKLIKDRHQAVNGKLLDALHMVYIYDIVNKLSRLATTPDHIDTWHDIAGYAMLVEEALKKQETKKECNTKEADDEAAVIEFINLMEALTGKDSEITKMSKEAYDDYKKAKENGTR